MNSCLFFYLRSYNHLRHIKRFNFYAHCNTYHKQAIQHIGIGALEATTRQKYIFCTKAESFSYTCAHQETSTHDMYMYVTDLCKKAHNFILIISAAKAIQHTV